MFKGVGAKSIQTSLNHFNPLAKGGKNPGSQMVMD